MWWASNNRDGLQGVRKADAAATHSWKRALKVGKAAPLLRPDGGGVESDRGNQKAAALWAVHQQDLAVLNQACESAVNGWTSSAPFDVRDVMPAHPAVPTDAQSLTFREALKKVVHYRAVYGTVEDLRLRSIPAAVGDPKRTSLQVGAVIALADADRSAEGHLPQKTEELFDDIRSNLEAFYITMVGTKYLGVEFDNAGWPHIPPDKSSGIKQEDAQRVSAFQIQHGVLMDLETMHGTALAIQNPDARPQLRWSSSSAAAGRGLEARATYGMRDWAFLVGRVDGVSKFNIADMMDDDLRTGIPLIDVALDGQDWQDHRGHFESWLRSPFEARHAAESLRVVADLNALKVIGDINPRDFNLPGGR